MAKSISIRIIAPIFLLVLLTVAEAADYQHKWSDEGDDEDESQHKYPPTHNYPPKTPPTHNYPPKSSSEHNYPPKNPPAHNYPPKSSPEHNYPPKSPPPHNYPPKSLSEHNYPPKSPPPPHTYPPKSPPPPHTYPPKSPPPPKNPPTNSVPSESGAHGYAKCKNKGYPQCYNIKHVCPSSCPGGCEVDCVTCKAVCKCDKPGAVCQDPRFIGGDGITFYFHGKKNLDFCLVSDPNLHINAHFIGKRNENMKRDFTWVQSIGILFDTHQLFIGALKTSTWNDANDRLAISFDGQSVFLPTREGASWRSASASASITRTSDTNSVTIEVQDKFKITAKVVPITEEDSRVHNYGITNEDCFAHLDLGFKFFSLSNEVNGVLGQTYRPNYVTPVKMGVKMPIMGGDNKFKSTSLFTSDCAVARFTGSNEVKGENTFEGLELPSMRCTTDGPGVVCRR